jgi:hypothetical protein
LDPAEVQLATHPLFWKYLLRKQTTSKILNKRFCIPQEMQIGLHKNCEKKVSPEVEAKVRVAENAPITFGDFETALKDIINGSALGPRSIHGHCKHGQEIVTEVHQFAYTHMSALLQMQEIPQ